jgi:predicted nucleic acid-binding protein
VRRFKPDKRRGQIRPRARSALLAADDIVGPGRPVLVPDTNVYIMDAGGNLPEAAAALVDRALLFHCAVCLAELAAGVANADPALAGWAEQRDHYAELFEGIPDNRVLAPDARTWTEAGIVAGTLARSQGFQRHQRKECLNDAAIYLTAAKAGLPVLTADAADFDLIQQVAPEGRFVWF